MLEKNGFFEAEIARQVDQYGGVVQAFSTYESRHKAEDAAPSCAASTASSFSMTAALVGGNGALGGGAPRQPDSGEVPEELGEVARAARYFAGPLRRIS